MVEIGNMQLADVTFSAAQWLQLIGLGGAVGALGQGIRSLIGLKKVHDATSTEDMSMRSALAFDRLFISLAIGFVAGALAATGIITDLSKVTNQQIFALAAAGYAGADFIEGFVRRVAPAPNLPVGQEGMGTGTTKTAAVAADDGAVG
jgi:hypothetical protein